MIAFYCKPPVSDLFVEESRFDGKGFEMIAHIDHHFNLLGTVDSLGYIFDLIDIKKLEQLLWNESKTTHADVPVLCKQSGLPVCNQMLPDSY